MPTCVSSLVPSACKFGEGDSPPSLGCRYCPSCGCALSCGCRLPNTTLQHRTPSLSHTLRTNSTACRVVKRPLVGSMQIIDGSISCVLLSRRLASSIELRPLSLARTGIASGDTPNKRERCSEPRSAAAHKARWMVLLTTPQRACTGPQWTLARGTEFIH